MSYDLQLSPELTAFRDELRTFVSANLPAEARRGVRLNVASMFEPEISRPWHAVLHAHGLSAPGWPVEYGGRGWDAIRQYIWRMECWRAGAPAISPFGMRLVAPALMKFGTEAQKARFLPPLLSGDDYWCQGFSEPGAGSDLAGLACQAVLTDDDHYGVQGTKLWQTHAHHSNWMLTLVRTATEGKPQAGVSCLLIDLTAPGVTIRPIHTIGGDHEVNQVFLDEAIVPTANRIGAEGDGWRITKYLLEEERRSAGNAVGRLRNSFGNLLRLLRQHPERWERPGVRGGIGRIVADIDTLEIIDIQQLLGGAEAFDASLMKLRASVIEQDITEVAILALGQDSLRWSSVRPLENIDAGDGELEMFAVLPRYLNGRARTIYGGASEVQKDIISKNIGNI